MAKLLVLFLSICGFICNWGLRLIVEFKINNYILRLINYKLWKFLVLCMNSLFQF